MTRCVAFRLRDVARNMRHARVATHGHVLQPAGTCCNPQARVATHRHAAQHTTQHATISATCWHTRAHYRHTAVYERLSPRRGTPGVHRRAACCTVHRIACCASSDATPRCRTSTRRLRAFRERRDRSRSTRAVGAPDVVLRHCCAPRWLARCVVLVACRTLHSRWPLHRCA